MLRRRWRLLLGIVIAGTLVLTGCNWPGSAREISGEEDGPPPELQAEDLVDLTIYLRAGEGEDAYLVPVTREVAVEDDLPRRALELLIAGPTGDDDRKLQPLLPSSTRIRDLHVDGDTAHVDLSEEVIVDAAAVEPTPEHETLALAAVADTLTEFPAIEQVRLTVEGQSSGWVDGVNVGAFWGGWGLPEVLTRNDRVVEPESADEHLPDLAAFSRETQKSGSADAEPVDIASVRANDRTTYLRVSVELTSEDDEAAAAIPLVRARAEDDDIVLEIRNVASYEADVSTGQQLDVDDPAFESVVVAPAELPGSVEVVVTPTEEREFLLHTLTSPTRVVLDVRK